MADGIIAAYLNQTQYSADDDRALEAVLAAPGPAVGTARPGVRPTAAGTLLTVGGTPEAVTLAPHSGIVTDPAGGGSYTYVVPSTVSRTLPARPATGNSRIHELVIRVRNADVRPTDNTREMEVYLLSGAESPSPTAPTVPSGQMSLGRLTVPASGAVVVANPPQRTSSLGGVLLLAGAGEETAAVAYDGMLGYREDLRQYRERRNGTWQPLLRLDRCEIRATSLQSPVLGSGANIVIQHHAVIQDNNALADLAGNRIVIKTAGTYKLRGLVAFAQGATPGQGYRRARLLVNGTPVRGFPLDASGTTGLATLVPVEVTRDLAVNDAITLDAFHTYGAALNTVADAAQYFSSLAVEQLAP